MKHMWRYTLLSLAFFAACNNSSDAKLDSTLKAESGEAMLGGETTHFAFDDLTFNLHASNMADSDEHTFISGNDTFNASWEKAPGTNAELDGLGPLFNATSCLSCHLGAGRGGPPDPGQQPESLLFRLSLPNAHPVIASNNSSQHPRPHTRQLLLPLALFTSAFTAPVTATSAVTLNNLQFDTISEPNYGRQLHPNSTDPSVPAEASINITYIEIPGTYSDGTTYSLRRPQYVFEDLGYGAMDGDLLVSPRSAPHLIGLGLLEAIAKSDIISLTDENDINGDGISGRANYVSDAILGGKSLGRFGWKSNSPSVRQIVAGAFNGDLGVTSSLFFNENNMPSQTQAAAQTQGGSPELSDLKLDQVTFYMQMIGVPGRRNVDVQKVLQGREIFRSMKCAACHVEKYTTANDHPIPALRKQNIRPFTDLLLHDMGDRLADGRPDGEAGTHEWRTAPLWGVGLFEQVNGHNLLMHDGRARGFAEAILWHGGEGEGAKEAFRTASQQDREHLIAYLESL